MTQPVYQKWENGKCKPNYEKLEKIADFFGVSLDWLFGRKQMKVKKRSPSFQLRTNYKKQKNE